MVLQGKYQKIFIYIQTNGNIRYHSFIFIICHPNLPFFIRAGGGFGGRSPGGRGGRGGFEEAVVAEEVMVEAEEAAEETAEEAAEEAAGDREI